MSGWIYGVYHQSAPKGEDGACNIKFGRSKYHPDRDSLDGRVRKLDLSVIALGFGSVSHAVDPFQVSDHAAFERKLKAELKRLGVIVAPPGKRQLTEVCRMPVEDFRTLVIKLKNEFES